MKNRFSVIAAALLLATVLYASAEDKPQAKACSPEFERMKSLVGTWAGKADMGNGPVEMTVTYSLIAGGSVLEERVCAGTPQEMTTMYYDRKGKLMATHYCVLGNQPQFVLKSSDANSLTFDFDKSCGIDTKKESHMHNMKIVFKDPNTITTSCVSYMDGKPSPACETVLTRVK